MNLVAALGGFADLFARNDDQRTAIHMLQGGITCQLQMKRAIQMLAANRNSKEGLTGMALAAFTGDIFGAIVGFASLMGPSTDQMILQQLQLIRQDIRDVHNEVKALRNDVEKRFSQLNLTLQYYFKETFDQFHDVLSAIGNVTVSLEKVHDKLNEVRLTQADIQRDLPRLDESITKSILTALNRTETEKFNYLWHLLKKNACGTTPHSTTRSPSR